MACHMHDNRINFMKTHDRPALAWDTNWTRIIYPDPSNCFTCNKQVGTITKRPKANRISGSSKWQLQGYPNTKSSPNPVN